MDLIERYVSAVGAKLQPVRRRKVEAELRAAIMDALEARGSTEASEADVVAVLTEFGDPGRVAAEYEPGQQYLIGPELYPHFLRGLRAAMATIVAVSALAFCVSLLMGGLAGYEAGGLLVQTLMYAGGAAAAVVIVLMAVFTWMQRAEVSVPRRALPDAAWDPRRLPSRPEADRAGRFDAVVGLVSAAAALVVVGLIGQVAREAGPHASPQIQSLIRDAVSRNVMLLQLALVVAALANAVALVQGRWRSWTYGMRWVADATALFVFVPLPFRLMSARAALLESGMTPNVVNWLVANAFIFAAVLAGLMIHSWWRVARRAARAGAPSLGTHASIALLGALLIPLSACAIGTRHANIVMVTESADTPVGRAPVVSPEIDRDGRVTYRYHAPGASQVVLVAEGMEPLLMTRDVYGVWSYTSDPMVPDLYLYSFVVDGDPTHDPANVAGVPTADGGRQSLAHVRAPHALPWESSGAPAGEMKRVPYRSVRFDEERDVWVYTPPGYDRTQGRRYPTLYLLHGVGEDARAWGTAGRVNVILDNMLASGEVEPMIVVMPLGYGFPNSASRTREMLSPLTDQLAVSRELGAALIEEVVPLIERQYRVRPDRESRAIAGLSMGGSQALHIGLTHRERFAHVASFGGALIMYGGRYDEWFPRMAVAVPDMPQSLHLSVGSEDFLLGVNRHFAGWLNANGTAAYLDEVPGGHTWQVWRRELIRLVPQLFNNLQEI